MVACLYKNVLLDTVTKILGIQISDSSDDTLYCSYVFHCERKNKL